jgi:hypothetical protein
MLELGNPELALRGWPHYGEKNGHDGDQREKAPDTEAWCPKHSHRSILEKASTSSRRFIPHRWTTQRTSTAAWHVLLFGLTNEAFGYILTNVDFQSFPRYDYVSRTSLGEMTGEILIEKSLELVNRSPALDR